MDSSHLAVFKRYLGIMLWVYAAWIILYYFTGWIGTLRGPAFDAALPVDAHIPLIPWFQTAYLLCYIVPLGLFIISLEPAFLNRSFLAFMVMNGFAFAFFIVFPVLGPPRDPLPVGATAEHWLLLFNHVMDTRYNALPSLHVANPWLVALFSWRERGPGARTYLLLGVALLISAATLFVKQHYLLDVLVGFLLAVVAFMVFRKLRISGKRW
jgi:membrane-associated phospholipid phosphatase